MPIYFFSSSITTLESDALERRIRKDIPDLQKVANVEDMGQQLRRTPSTSAETNYMLFPFSDASVSIERLVHIADRGRDLFFFIFISNDISASDYKQLVRTGNADWAPSRGVPQEVLDIISRRRKGPETADLTGKAAEARKPILVSFVPSAGGVGNTTLAIETAIQIKAGKLTRDRAVCIVDLDFQTSHVCDLLDIDPRLQIEDISRQPERLDAQLFELFISHHSTGVDVLASPRNKQISAEANIAALDALFAMVSQRYNLILVDLPVNWVAATRQLLSVSDLAVVTGLDTIPSLRQVTDTVKAIRDLEQSPSQVVVALNRCQAGLLGGVASRQYVKRMLETETVIYIRDHPAAAHESVNTGVPVYLTSPSSKISKDTSKLASLVSALQSTRTTAAAPA